MPELFGAVRGEVLPPAPVGNPDADGMPMAGAGSLAGRLMPLGRIRSPFIAAALARALRGIVLDTEDNPWMLVADQYDEQAIGEGKDADSPFEELRKATYRANGWTDESSFRDLAYARLALRDFSSPQLTAGGNAQQVIQVEWALPVEIWSGIRDARIYAERGNRPGLVLVADRWARIAVIARPNWPHSDDVGSIVEIVFGVITTIVGAILTLIPITAAIGGPILTAGIALLTDGITRLAGDAAAAAVIGRREALSQIAVAEGAKRIALIPANGPQLGGHAPRGLPEEQPQPDPPPPESSGGPSYLVPALVVGAIVVALLMAGPTKGA